MLLMHQDLWKHVEASSNRSRSSTSLEDSSLDQEVSSYKVVIPTSAASEKIKACITTSQLIISILTDSVMLNVIHLHDPKIIWNF